MTSNPSSISSSSASPIPSSGASSSSVAGHLGDHEVNKAQVKPANGSSVSPSSEAQSDAACAAALDAHEVRQADSSLGASNAPNSPTFSITHDQLQALVQQLVQTQLQPLQTEVQALKTNQAEHQQALAQSDLKPIQKELNKLLDLHQRCSSNAYSNEVIEATQKLLEWTQQAETQAGKHPGGLMKILDWLDHVILGPSSKHLAASKGPMVESGLSHESAPVFVPAIINQLTAILSAVIRLLKGSSGTVQELKALWKVHQMRSGLKDKSKVEDRQMRAALKSIKRLQQPLLRLSSNIVNLVATVAMATALILSILVGIGVISTSLPVFIALGVAAGGTAAMMVLFTYKSLKNYRSKHQLQALKQAYDDLKKDLESNKQAFKIDPKKSYMRYLSKDIQRRIKTAPTQGVSQQELEALQAKLFRKIIRRDHDQARCYLSLQLADIANDRSRNWLAGLDLSIDSSKVEAIQSVLKTDQPLSEKLNRAQQIGEHMKLLFGSIPVGDLSPQFQAH